MEEWPSTRTSMYPRSRSGDRQDAISLSSSTLGLANFNFEDPRWRPRMRTSVV